MDSLTIQASMSSTTEDIVRRVVQDQRAALPGVPGDYELTEAMMSGGHVCKERRLGSAEHPASIQLLWPAHGSAPAAELYRTCFQFVLRRRRRDEGSGGGSGRGASTVSMRDTPMAELMRRFLERPESDCREYEVERVLDQRIKLKLNGGVRFRFKFLLNSNSQVVEADQFNNYLCMRSLVVRRN